MSMRELSIAGQSRLVLSVGFAGLLFHGCVLAQASSTQPAASVPAAVSAAAGAPVTGTPATASPTAATTTPAPAKAGAAKAKVTANAAPADRAKTTVKSATAKSEPGKPAVATTRLQAVAELPPPRSTIFLAVDSSGVLMLSDRPAGQGSHAGSQTFSASSDAESLARAQRERDYWRFQADQFRARQREREREIEESQRIRLLESRRNAPDYYAGGRIYARGADWWASHNAPLVGGFSTAPVYSSSPGAVPGGSNSFIGSGFSRAAGR